MSPHHRLRSPHIRCVFKLGVHRGSLDTRSSLSVLAGIISTIHYLKILNKDLISHLLLDNGIRGGLVDKISLLERILAVHIAESW